MRLVVLGDRFDPDGRGLFALAGLQQQLRQPDLSVEVLRRGRSELPLVLERGRQVALLFAQLRQLAEQVGVPGVLREQAFELLAGGPEVAGRLVRLGDAQGVLAGLVGLPPLALEAFEELVELVSFEVQVGQAVDDAELAFEVVGLLERPPQEFDRLALPAAFGQCVGQRVQAARLAGVGADRAAQGLQALFHFAELEAEVRVRLVHVRVAGGGREQFLAGGQRGVAAAEALFEFHDLRQVVRPEAAVDQGELLVRVHGRFEVAAGLVDAGRGGQCGDRPRGDLRRLDDRLDRLVRLLVRLVEPGQHDEPLAGRVLPGGEVFLQLVDAVGELVEGLVNLDAGRQDLLDLVGVAGELGRQVDLGQSVLVAALLVEQVGVGREQVEVVLFERDRLGHRVDGLLAVAEAGEHLGEPGEVLAAAVLALGAGPPGGQCVARLLQVVVVLAQVLAVLRVFRGEFDRLLVQGDGLVRQAAEAVQVGDLRRDDGVGRLLVEDLPPDRRRGGLPLRLGLGRVAGEELAPLAEHVRVARVGLRHRLVLGGRAGEVSFAGELVDERLPQAFVRRRDFEALFEPLAGVRAAALGDEVLRQPRRRVHVGRVGDQPLLVVLGQPGEVVVAQEHVFDAAADVAVQPTLGVQFGEQFLEIREGLGGLLELHLDVRGVHAERRLAVLVVGQLGEPFEPRQRLVVLPLVGQGGGDLLLDAGVVGVLSFEPGPHVEGLVGLLRPLVDAAEGAVNVEQVVAVRLAQDGALEGTRRVFRPADEDQDLAQVERRQGTRGQGLLGLGERGDGRPVLAPLGLDQADDHPRRAVLRIGLRAGRVLADELVQRPPLDVVAVQLVEGGAAARVAFEDLAEPLGDGLVLGLFGVRVVRLFGRRGRRGRLRGLRRLADGNEGERADHEQGGEEPKSSVPHLSHSGCVVFLQRLRGAGVFHVTSAAGRHFTRTGLHEPRTSFSSAV